MIYLEPCFDKKIIQSVLQNTHLCDLVFGKNSLEKIMEFDHSIRYIGIYESDSTLLGLYTIRPFTKITVEAHIYILPEYQGIGKSLEIAESGKDWLRFSTQYQNIITTVPSNCLHSVKYVNHIGFQHSGTISQGIIYNDEVTDLLIYTYNLR